MKNFWAGFEKRAEEDRDGWVPYAAGAGGAALGGAAGHHYQNARIKDLAHRAVGSAATATAKGLEGAEHLMKYVKDSGPKTITEHLKQLGTAKHVGDHVLDAARHADSLAKAHSNRHLPAALGAIALGLGAFGGAKHLMSKNKPSQGQ
jgi:hypothetical protein